MDKRVGVPEEGPYGSTSAQCRGPGPRRDPVVTKVETVTGKSVLPGQVTEVETSDRTHSLSRDPNSPLLRPQRRPNPTLEDPYPPSHGTPTLLPESSDLSQKTSHHPHSLLTSPPQGSSTHPQETPELTPQRSLTCRQRFPDPSIYLRTFPNLYQTPLSHLQTPLTLTRDFSTSSLSR